MFWSRCVRNTSNGTVRPEISLRDATRLARSMGCLGAPPPAAASSSSAAAPHAPAEAALRLRRCTGQRSPEDSSSSLAGSTWETLQRRQRHLFQLAHTPTEGPAVAATMSAINVAHVEGIVQAVLCGHYASHSGGVSGCGSPGLRTVHVTTPPPSEGAPSTVLLWLCVDPASSPCLLAVCCSLSPEVVDMHWSARRGETMEEDISPIASVGDSRVVASEREEEEGVAEAKLRCVKAWATAALLSRRVVVSGQLRMVEVFDGDVGKVVVVPVIELPQDNLMGCIKELGTPKNNNRP